MWVEKSKQHINDVLETAPETNNTHRNSSTWKSKSDYSIGKITWGVSLLCQSAQLTWKEIS